MGCDLAEQGSTPDCTAAAASLTGLRRHAREASPSSSTATLAYVFLRATPTSSFSVRSARDRETGRPDGAVDLVRACCAGLECCVAARRAVQIVPCTQLTLPPATRTAARRTPDGPGQAIRRRSRQLVQAAWITRLRPWAVLIGQKARLPTARTAPARARPSPPARTSPARLDPAAPPEPDANRPRSESLGSAPVQACSPAGECTARSCVSAASRSCKPLAPTSHCARSASSTARPGFAYSAER